MNIRNMALLGTFSIILGFIRFHITSEPMTTTGFYKDMAHLWVGGLYGAWAATGNRFYGFLAIPLTVLEGLAFLMTHKF
jgi:hypothetical protein